MTCTWMILCPESRVNCQRKTRHRHFDAGFALAVNSYINEPVPEMRGRLLIIDGLRIDFERVNEEDLLIDLPDSLKLFRRRVLLTDDSASGNGTTKSSQYTHSSLMVRVKNATKSVTPSLLPLSSCRTLSSQTNVIGLAPSTLPAGTFPDI